MENQVQAELDSWLSGIKGRVCFRNTFKLYAPTCNQKCLPAVKELADDLAKEFGGATVYEKATGYWWDAEGKKMYREPARVIEVAHSCGDRDKLKKLTYMIATYAKKADQLAISIKGNQFFIADSPELLQKFMHESLRDEVPG